MTETIGLVGVGLVGIELARHLMARGFPVAGYDIDPARLALLEASGGVPVRSLADVAARARRIVLALLDTPVTCAVVEREGGLLAAARPPRVVIDTGTGDPAAFAALAARTAAHGTRMMDATLSGSSGQIARRTAVVMVGATPEDFAAHRELLDAFADRVFHLGPPGSGMKAKLASNVILGLNRLALAEGLALARALGLDLPAFLAMAKASPAYSVAMDVKGQRMLDGRYGDPDSRIRQHLKDLDLILAAARGAGLSLPVSALHRDLLAAAVAAGDGELDNAAILRRYPSREKQ